MKTISTMISALALLTALPGIAHSDGLRPGDGDPNGADTLRRGETQVGLTIHPMAVGLTDRLQISTHPILLLLGVAELGAKLKIIDGNDFDLSLAGNYFHMFADGPSALAAGNRGQLDGSLAFAWHANPSFTLGARASAARSFIYDDGKVDLGIARLEASGASGVGGGAWTDVAFGQHDLLVATFDMLQPLVDDDGAAVTVNGVRPSDRHWQASLMYAHAWESFRLGLGAFSNSALVADGHEVMPMVDIWWRF